MNLLTKKVIYYFILKKNLFTSSAFFLSFGFVKLSLVAIAINTVNIHFLLS